MVVACVVVSGRTAEKEWQKYMKVRQICVDISVRLYTTLRVFLSAPSTSPLAEGRRTNDHLKRI